MLKEEIEDSAPVCGFFIFLYATVLLWFCVTVILQ